MKIKIIIITISIVVLAILIGCFVYFVSGVSAVSPPIKEYQYLGSVNQLIAGMQKYATTNNNVTFKITDTVGSREKGYGIYMTVGIKNNGHDITYRLMSESDDNNSIVKTKVHLILAFDETAKTGGYQLSGKGVRPLVDSFDTSFLVDLKNKQNITISPL